MSEEILARRKIFERNINIQVIQDEEIPDKVLVRASLLDLAHSMHVYLTIDLQTRIIEKAEGKMMKVPFKECRLSEIKVRNIEGLEIKRGINREIARRVGGSEGCTHFVEILQSAMRFTSANLIGIETERTTKTPAEREARTFEILRGTCVAFNENYRKLEVGK